MNGFWITVGLLIVGVVILSLMKAKPGMQKEYRDNAMGLAGLLRYAAPVANGVLTGKGGELIAGFFYRGTDTESAANSELEAIATRLNSTFKRLGSGWMMHVEAIRGSAIGYPSEGHSRQSWRE